MVNNPMSFPGHLLNVIGISMGTLFLYREVRMLMMLLLVGNIVLASFEKLSIREYLKRLGFVIMFSYFAGMSFMKKEIADTFLFWALFSFMVNVKGYVIVSFFTWASAVLIPLDWDVWYQVFPVCTMYGLFVGVIVSVFYYLFDGKKEKTS